MSDDLVIIGDEAWDADELDAYRAKRAKARVREAEYRARNRERIAAYFREYRRRNGDRVRKQHRESAARRRLRAGTLHDLGCTGPGQCRCRVVWRVTSASRGGGS